MMAQQRWSKTILCIKSLLSSLTCPLCSSTMSKPAGAGRCSHMYCYDCIITQCGASGESLCPDCKEPFWLKDIHIHHEIEQIISLCRDILPKFEADLSQPHSSKNDIPTEKSIQSHDCVLESNEGSEDQFNAITEQDENVPLYYTPPEKDLEDPNSFVTASNDSPKQLVCYAHEELSGVAGSSCKTLNLGQPSEPYTNFDSIFDDSIDADLPAFDLDDKNEDDDDDHKVSNIVKRVPNVSLPTTPVEVVSQESHHVRPVEKTYSRKGKHRCPKDVGQVVEDSDNQVSNWIQNSVLFNSSALDDLLKDASKEDTEERCLKTPRKTRSRSNTSSMKSIGITKTVIQKRKSTEQLTKSKKLKASPLKTPSSKAEIISSEIKTPLSKSKTSGRIPRTPTSTPRNKRNQKGETLLHKATIAGDVDKLRSLLDEGDIDVNARDNAGWTTLHEACIKKHLGCVELLLDHGAQVNAKADNLDTPLHDACANSAIEIVKLLLDNGACKTLKNVEGHTPVNLAVSDEVLKLLDEATDTKNLSVLNEDGVAEENIVNPVIAFSGVVLTKMREFQNINVLSYKMEEEVSNKVTHLVCAVNENKACRRTIKFFKAMSLGIVIISTTWLEESQKASMWLNVSDYIIKGATDSDKEAPYKSYLDHRSGVPGLFTGLTFYVDKKLENGRLNGEILCNLIRSMNGKLINRVPKETTVQKNRVYHAAQDSLLHSSSTIIVSKSLKSGNVLVKTPDWVLQSISDFRLTD